jgi:Fe-S-cluster containining protein
LTDSTNICVPCGACCDGTLIGFVDLDPNEIGELKGILEIENEKDHGFFLQPCKKLCNDGCSVYAKRPKKCDNFKCGLLKSFTKGDVDFDSAIAIIQNLKRQKKSIEDQVLGLKIDLKSQSFHFKIAELRNRINGNNIQVSQNKAYSKLTADIDHLDKFLLSKFSISLY